MCGIVIQIASKLKILVVAAHPDDETLGCAGTIARHKNDGDVVEVCFMTNGVSARKNTKLNDIRQRKNAALKAQNILGIKKTYYNNFQDNMMDKSCLLDVIKCIEKIIYRSMPEIVYTHFHGDLNIDHRITHQATMTACRPQPKCPVNRIFGFEIPSSTGWTFNPQTEFHPTRFVNITKTIEKKILALNTYSIEMRSKPHIRSIENLKNLAVYRGNFIGIPFAEAFVSYREII